MKPVSSTFLLQAVAAIFLLGSPAALAFTQSEPTQEQQEQFDAVWKPLEVSGSAIPWEIFSSTQEREECRTDADGYRECFLLPEYGAPVKGLDGTEVTLMGFMFPLEQTEKQGTFLIGPYPLSCPYHYHVGPNQVIEVQAADGVDFTYEPVTLTGRLALRYEEETGVFYFLENARLKKQ
jgi:hypothetical protein